MCPDALWNHSRDWNLPSTEFKPTAFDPCCFRRLPYGSGILLCNLTEWIGEVFWIWDPPLQSLLPFDGISSLYWEVLHVLNRQILQRCLLCKISKPYVVFSWVRRWKQTVDRRYLWDWSFQRQPETKAIEAMITEQLLLWCVLLSPPEITP